MYVNSHKCSSISHLICASLSQGQVGHWYPAYGGLAHRRKAAVWKLQGPLQTWIRPGAAWNHLWHQQHWEGVCVCVCASVYLSVCAWVYDEPVGFIRVWILIGLLILKGSLLLSQDAAEYMKYVFKTTEILSSKLNASVVISTQNILC